MIDDCGPAGPIKEGEPLVVIAEDKVPTADAEKPDATYRDWDRERTIVRTYWVGGPEPAASLRPIHWAPSRDDARADVRAKYGRILEENHLPGRSYFRVELRVGLTPTSIVSTSAPAGIQGDD